MKQYSKRALMAENENKGNFVDSRRRNYSDGSGSYGDDSYGSDDSRSYGSDSNPGTDDEDFKAEKEDDDMDGDVRSQGHDDFSNKLAKDKEWLDSFIHDKLKKQIAEVEQEVDNIRNKKIRGAIKKQKDMLRSLNDKLKLMRSTRENCEELAMTMEFLEGGAIKTLKGHLRKYYDLTANMIKDRKYYDEHENEIHRVNVDKEVTSLIDLADQNRKKEDILHSGQISGLNTNQEEEEKKQVTQDISDKYAHLGWLNKLIDLNDSENQDIIISQQIERIEDLKVGDIIDAQDYLDTWHLSIVCKIQPKNEQEYLKVNYLPYPKGNRDEWISKKDSARLSGPFYNSESIVEKELEPIEKGLKQLRDYVRNISGNATSSGKDASKGANSSNQGKKQ